MLIKQDLFVSDGVTSVSVRLECELILATAADAATGDGSDNTDR